jgi:hypothetical protein
MSHCFRESLVIFIFSIINNSGQEISLRQHDIGLLCKEICFNLVVLAKFIIVVRTKPNIEVHFAGVGKSNEVSDQAKKMLEWWRNRSTHNDSLFSFLSCAGTLITKDEIY